MFTCRFMLSGIEFTTLLIYQLIAPEIAPHQNRYNYMHILILKEPPIRIIVSLDIRDLLDWHWLSTVSR